MLRLRDEVEFNGDELIIMDGTTFGVNNLPDSSFNVACIIEDMEYKSVKYVINIGRALMLQLETQDQLCISQLSGRMNYCFHDFNDYLTNEFMGRFELDPEGVIYLIGYSIWLGIKSRYDLGKVAISMFESRWTKNARSRVGAN